MNEAMTTSAQPARTVTFLNMLNEGSSAEPLVKVTLGAFSSGLENSGLSMDTVSAPRRINFS